ncbi:MAG: hypothetical protein KBD24_03040 [Candidatus Pacebacteria bacterium]|nr:hypothetical protein [Candidatus Paceibacterota bacterium]
MLFEYLEHVRAQSIQERKRFAFLFSFGVTGVITLIWLSVIFANQDSIAPADASVPMVAESSQALADEGVFTRFTKAVRSATNMTTETESDAPVPGTDKQTSVESNARFESVFSASPTPSTPPPAEDGTLVKVDTSSSTTNTHTQPVVESVEEDTFVDGVLNEVNP